MSRHRSGSKKAPPEIGLHMECTEEELEPCQIVHYNKAETEYNELQNKLDHYLNKMKAEVVEKGENCIVLQLNVSSGNTVGSSSQVPSVSPSGKVTRQTVQATQNYQQVVGQGILTRSSANATGNTYLVMDPCLGLVVGQVPSTTGSTPESATATPAKQVSGPRGRSTSGTVMVTTRARSGVKKPGSGTSETEVLPPSVTRTREKVKGQTQIQQPASPPSNQLIQQVFSPGNTAAAPGSYRIKLNVKPLPPVVKPCESNAIGGLTAGSKTPWKPNSEDGNSKGNAADSKEVTFNKMSGKTFPSLVVAARPHLRLKYIPQSSITQERTGLDAKVKGVLMYTPTTFTEWLIQEGLIKNEQICQFHVNNDLTPVELKLGMYSDVSKFPYSGGYVWISSCCPSQFVSVFSGSIFEGAPHPPTTILKLIYHWACQTNVQNVVQWVKVDNLYVKNFFTNMRAVCAQAIHQKHRKMGGPRSKIEVGVISLGTTSQDGNMRQVKVEVLGVMDPENKVIRLRALEPASEEKNFKRRFVKILEPLAEWVHKESTLFTDFTVDKTTLVNMGFRTVYQTSSSDPPTKYSNQNVMEYLRRIVPRMFQNTLSLLSRQIIQQFLDELVWRETWGPIPSQAFDNIIAHLAEQTKLESSESLLVRLNKVASNPFKNWNYSVWKPAPITLSNTKAQQPVGDLDTVPLFKRLATMDSSESASILKNNRSKKRTADQAISDVMTTSSSNKKATKVSPKDKTKREDKPRFLEKIFKKDTSEKEKTITEDIVAFINDKTAQIPLNSYYYGTKEGDEELISGEYKGPFQIRCSVCNVQFDENIRLMKHMILHSQLEPLLKVGMSNVQQCNYCFLGFNTTVELKEHSDEVHFLTQNKSGNVTDCLICEEKFSNRVELIYHMHRTHVEMELPYECGACHYRTSVYNQLIDHFVQIHKGGEHILCPHCLKIFTCAYKGKILPGNIRLYEYHLEKHNRTTLTKGCHRCKLSFIHKGIIDQHLEADHCSFKYESGVKPFTDSPNTIMMPEPGSLIKPVTPPKSLKIYRARPIFTLNKFKALEVNGIEDDMACIECEGSLTKSEHFTGNFNCLKCRYATCCEKAMAEHSTIFHESPVPQFTMGKPIVLPEGMFCPCGFCSYSGNKIAKHLALCDKKSAYPTEETANAAMISKDDDTSKIPSSDGHNVLNMLGLVRKSPELGAVSGDSMKKEDESECLEGSVKEEMNSSIEEKTEDSVSGLGMEINKNSEENDNSRNEVSQKFLSLLESQSLPADSKENEEAENDVSCEFEETSDKQGKSGKNPEEETINELDKEECSTSKDLVSADDATENVVPEKKKAEEDEENNVMEVEVELEEERKNDDENGDAEMCDLNEKIVENSIENGNNGFRMSGISDNPAGEGEDDIKAENMVTGNVKSSENETSIHQSDQEKDDSEKVTAETTETLEEKLVE